MVSIVDIMLGDVHRALIDQKRTLGYESVEGAFVVWMNNDIDDSVRANLPSDFTVTDYHHVAILAFLMEINSVDYKDYDSLLIDGLSRVAGRTITLFETEPAPFRNDAIALLGLALGAKKIGGDIQAKVLQWMQTFIKPSDKVTPSWKRVFSFVTLYLLGAPVDLRDLQDLSESRDIQLAFKAKGCDIFGDINFNLAYQECCHNTMIENFEPSLAACRLTTLHYLSKGIPIISINNPTVQQVVELLNRLPAGLKRWPWEDKPMTKTGTAQKWDIQNEYHVQSLVYSLLAPIFPDIEDEFYLEPVAQLNPRADIGLPSLSLIIEIKFLRSGISFSKVIEEIAADASLYFKRDSVFSKKYSQMIVLLWDNSSRTQHDHEFNKGVNQLANILGSIVISRPGNMPVYTPVPDTVKLKLNKKKSSS